jgi:hypothetical protein
VSRFWDGVSSLVSERVKGIAVFVEVKPFRGFHWRKKHFGIVEGLVSWRSVKTLVPTALATCLDYGLARVEYSYRMLCSSS